MPTSTAAIATRTALVLSLSAAAATELGAQARSTPADVMDDRVVVTPFANISSAPEDAWIATGIAATLAAELERGGDLRVVGPHAPPGGPRDVSGVPPANREPDHLAAGRQLGARWVISGGYQRQQDRMRIIPRIGDVADRVDCAHGDRRRHAGGAFRASGSARGGRPSRLDGGGRQPGGGRA